GLDRILNKYLDKRFTEILEKELTVRGVTLALGENVTEFISDEVGKVYLVATRPDSFDTDLVVLCVGFRRHTTLLAGLV
ncbi:FAD-dependent oxidoreductase, partial [Enterococcus faecium]|uniref:FAD-dependent oxidoreductase n=1 Tax=Enterococcus faecium TaxID=1352 RepID=UPI003CC5EA7D